MTEFLERQAEPQARQRLRVLIAGGGVAGLEAAFALQKLAPNRVDVRILSDSDTFSYRPLAMGEPFSSSHAEHYSLERLAAAADAELIRDTVTEVDADKRVARTASGRTLRYDELVLALGAKPRHVLSHATKVDDARMDELLHGLVQDIEVGFVRRLAIVVPAPMPWPLPAYELALMASERAWDMQVEMDVTLFTPEHAPLQMFGTEASRALSRLLAQRRIDVVTSAHCEVPEPGTVVVHPGGRAVTADRVVALPQLAGPALEGLPQDGGGFIPVDEYGRVRGVDHVWAAGDATDYPIKQGGVATQLADTVAGSIAALSGGNDNVKTFTPVLEGVLMTGGTPRYLRGNPASPSGDSVFSAVVRGASPPKISARYLGPHLGREMVAA